MPVVAAPATRMPALPIRVPVREIAVLVDGLVLSLEEWTRRRPDRSQG